MADAVEECDAEECVVEGCDAEDSVASVASVASVVEAVEVVEVVEVAIAVIMEMIIIITDMVTVIFSKENAPADLPPGAPFLVYIIKDN